MQNLIFDLTILVVGSAVLAYLAVLLKQPIIMAYILWGVLVGPWGLGWIGHVESIETISHFGITLLLFLAGLCLHPQKLFGLFRKTSFVTLGSSLFSFLIAFSFALLGRFTLIESICIGLALMFSSTILVVKLLPTTKLHQKRMGAICISILILQDLLAIAVLAFVRCLGSSQGVGLGFLVLLIKLCVFLAALFLLERTVLRKVILHVERKHEVLFIMGLAWCLGISIISNQMGLFYETGAFFAGVVLAKHKISFFITEKLKPLRDFFLVLFFFSLGAKLNLAVIANILWPSIFLALIFVIVKPWVFTQAFLWSGEEAEFSRETGMRLGQLSEFSLLIALLAFELGHIGTGASQLIQLTTIITFILSSYLVVFKYPTPIGTSEELMRD